MPRARSEYTFSRWKKPGDIGQCYSDVASGDILTIYTPDSRQSWIPYTRQLNSSTTVIGAHINGWIFAQQTPTPAAPTSTPTATPTATEPVTPSRSSGMNTSSAIVFGIGVALSVVGAVVLAAGIVVMRGSRKTLRVVQSAVRVPNSRPALSQENSQRRHMHQTSHGGVFLPVPASMRQWSLPSLEKEPQELDGSHPSC